MSSPIMVERVREVPLIVEKDIPMDCEDSGFPFDDDCDEQEDSRFRSQLDDLSVRHPELAQHLGSFPFRSGSRARTQIPEHFGHQRFTDRPFGERFERFGFPFEEEQEQKPYYQRYPKYYPTQETGEQSCSNQETQNPDSESREEVTQPEESEWGKRPKKNIQQSNTVDLGQPQEPVDERNQRSMSAPPPNDRPRFVSSINIPVNQTEEKKHDAPQMSSQPQERVIPIHVEGRDEPIIPKKFASQNASQPQAHPQQPQPSTDKFFTQRSPNFSQYFNREQPFQNDWFPRGFHGTKPQTQSNFTQGQRGRSPQPQPKSEQPAPSPPQPQTANVPKPQKPAAHFKVETEEQPKTPEAPKCQASTKPDPINQIKSIQKDVSALMEQVDQFTGKPRDKQYLYLDEMLTRNLIKLDNIDTQGQENIRLARKEAIKCIEKCISILETKANANVGIKPTEAEQSDDAAKTAETDNVAEDKTMDVDVSSENTSKNASRANSEAKVVDKPVEEKMDTTPEVTQGGKPPGDSKEPEGQQAELTVSEEKKMETEESKTSEENKDESSQKEQDPEVTNSDDKKEKKKTKKKTEK